MSPSITLSNLSWSTPDGRSVLSDLNLAFGSERVGLVGRNGVGKTTLFNLIAGTLKPAAGSVSVDGRLAVLRQEVTPHECETIADLFGIAPALDILDRAERGEASADDLAVADWTLEVRAETALAKVGLDVTLSTKLAQLSGGQRTRAGLAALVFAEPDFILLDEPTNNLDRDGRAAVADLVAGWRSGAIVISHDRDLLEQMDAIVELTSLGATRYGGGWSRYRELKAAELAAAEHDLAEADKATAKAARNAQAIAERQARRNSVGKKRAARGDMPKIMIGKRRETSERTNAALAENADRQRSAAAEAQADARQRVEILQPMSVQLASVGLATGKQILELDRVAAGYDPARPVLRDVSFAINGPERVAIVGPNGSGKTTLLRLIAGNLAPSSGTVRVHTRFALFDQEVSLLDPTESIRDNYRRINEAEDENACRAALARFMFRADAATQIVGTLSGGQRLRAGLACVIGGATPPPLLILDEPTNHLDIASIESVEAGLRAFDGALLVVSHDAAFLEAIGIERRVALGG